jgi:DNA-binding Xre family transcriptional regulator
MSETPRRRVDDLSPEERAKVESLRARWKTPEHRAEEERVRELVREEFPPAKVHAAEDDALVSALAELRRERERQGLSLTDLSERTGIDRATISKLETGKVPNPTLETLTRYARALGKRLAWTLEDATAG